MDNTKTLTSSETSAFVQLRAATLDVRSGPMTGTRIRVESPRFVIGSGEEAELRLDDRTVSRAHVVLSMRPEGLVVSDEGSRNGTFVGAMRIREVVLVGDAVMKVGKTTIGVSIDAAASDVPIYAGDRFGDALGKSTTMRHLFHRLERASASDVSILLEGESGVGKDVLAHGIHQTSPRREAPFVAVDCGAIPPNLFESELFGHVKGAFTGALNDREGLAEQAHEGTLFLDEIGELPIDLQPKLLRLLEQREVRAVGGKRVRKIDVRIIAATNRGLAEAVAEGKFRQDLFYRLSVLRVVVPPLRDRAEDIEMLATALLRRSSGNDAAELDPEMRAMFASYRWPGNVRELKNAVERYVHLGARDRTGLFDSSAQSSEVIRTDLWGMRYHDAYRVLVDEFERAYLQRALAASGNVVVRAAEASGIPRPTFYRMLSRLGLKGATEK